MGRWTPLILTEMLSGSERFGDIRQGVPLMSRSLLSRRLKEMEYAGLIERVEQGRGHVYRLTESGRALRPLIDQLGEWGSAWRLPDLDERDSNVSYMMWILRRRFIGKLASHARSIVHFEFHNVARRDHKLRNWWMLIRDEDVDLCNTDMGFEPHLTVKADMQVFTRVICGTATLRQARFDGDITFAGDLRLQADFLAALNPPFVLPARMPVPPTDTVAMTDDEALASPPPPVEMASAVRTKTRAA